MDEKKGEMIIITITFLLLDKEEERYGENNDFIIIRWIII